MNDLSPTLSAADVERLATERGISIKDLCMRAEIAHTTFYRWRLGRTAPSLDVYQRIIGALRSAPAVEAR